MIVTRSGVGEKIVRVQVPRFTAEVSIARTMPAPSIKVYAVEGDAKSSPRVPLSRELVFSSSVSLPDRLQWYVTVVVSLNISGVRGKTLEEAIDVAINDLKKGCVLQNATTALSLSKKVATGVIPAHGSKIANFSVQPSGTAPTFCAKCGAEDVSSAKFCGSCGTPNLTGVAPQTLQDRTASIAPITNAQMAFCTQCGTSISAGAKFCGTCAKPVGGADSAASREAPADAAPPISPVNLLNPAINQLPKGARVTGVTMEQGVLFGCDARMAQRTPDYHIAQTIPRS